MSKVVIVIPIYKEKISESELASLRQCIKVLGKYPIEFICPESLNVSEYEKYLSSTVASYSYIRLNNKHFMSTRTYSNLLLMKDFYTIFLKYRFMLIYHLDAWVFEDKLEYWGEQDYDYIGAPWFKCNDTVMSDIAGNGGFSLRKIESIISVLNSNRKLSFSEIMEKYSPRIRIFDFFIFIINILRYSFQFAQKSYYARTSDNEDYVFVKYAKGSYPLFKVAPPEVALQFSFECRPKKLYEMNNNQLPFGCHAYKTYEYNIFWKEFIKIG